MQLLPLVLLIVVVGIAYTFIVPVLERFVDISPAEETKDLLVSADELPLIGPSVREELMRVDPKFIESLLDIEKDTIEIMGHVVSTVAGLLASEAQDSNVDAYRQEAIQYITKETGGTPPKFCAKDRLDRAFDMEASKGLKQLQNCLPARPAKYLLLLSYAAKVYMKQLREARESLGGAYSGSGAMQGGPELEMPSFAPPPNEDGTPRLPPDIFRTGPTKRSQEGFATKGGLSQGSTRAEGFQTPKAFINPNASLRLAEPFETQQTGSLYYSSSYLLPAPTKPLTASTVDTTLRSPLENVLDAWKTAYDAESVKQIRAYIRYCKWARKEIQAIKRDSESGGIVKKVQLPSNASPSVSASL